MNMQALAISEYELVEGGSGSVNIEFQWTGFSILWGAVTFPGAHVDVNWSWGGAGHVR